MIGIIRLVLLSSLSCILFQPEILWGQSASGDRTVELSRILNPMPDYDPFAARSEPTPKYFPDKTLSQVRELLIQSLMEPDKDLTAYVRYFEDRDAQLREERNTVTGLTDDVIDLNLTTIRDHSSYVAGLKEALDSASTEEQKNLIRSRIRNDEFTQAHQLMRGSKTNRIGALTNGLLRSVDLVDIASGSYLLAAVDSTVTQVLALKDRSMPVGERKSLVLFRQFLERYPDDPKRAEVTKLLEALEKKKKRYLAGRYLEQAEKALDEGQLARADLKLEMAYLTDPEWVQSEAGFDELRQRLKDGARPVGSSHASNAVRPTGDPRPAMDSNLEGLLYALTLRDAERIEAYAKAVEEQHPDSDLRESAKDAEAVAMEIRGRHDEAEKRLRRLARSSPSARQKERAKALLDSPNYNLLESVHKAQNQYRLDTAKYILLGENFLEKNLLIGIRPLMAQGVAGVNTWGLANLIFVGTNAFKVLTGDPVSDQPIIDKAVAYIKSHPDSESTTEVYRILAQAYEDRQDYQKAMAYYRLSGAVSEEKIASLKETAADLLLDRARGTRSKRSKESYLKGLLEWYPDSAAAKEAKGELAGLMRLGNRGAKISKQFLMENPDLYTEDGLGLKPSLFDGQISNMELADEGINLIRSKEILFHFDTPWGVQSRPYLVPATTVERFERALRRKNYQVALGDVHTRRAGSDGGLPNLPDKIRKGHGEEEPVIHDGTHITLVKRPTGESPDHQKVLDYELLSQNEQNPGSKFQLPELNGTVSADSIHITGTVPATLWGERLSFGTDGESPVAGLQLPIPLLQDFIPVDFLLQAGTGRPSLTPQFHTFQHGEDAALFR